MKKTNAPKVFISYSWSSTRHKEWVRDLAERLMSDGVNVILDQWDLKEGQDKFAFMEKMVADLELSRVLIVSDSMYAEKADKREGGAGTESQIISKEVYEKVDQEKFIPIATEFAENGEPYLPVYLRSRIYINLANEQLFHDEYEKLLRNIFDRPLLKKPPLGKPPAYIFQEEPTSLKTSRLLDRLKDAALKGSRYTKGFLIEYFSAFCEGLEELRLDYSTGVNADFDEKVIEGINKLLPYRDDLINAFLFLSQYDVIDSYTPEVHSFLERLAGFRYKPPSQVIWHEHYSDNYRFMLYESFLYIISALIKFRKIAVANSLLNTPYFVTASRGNRVRDSYGTFNSYIRSLEENRKRRLSLNRTSLTADLIIERCNHKELSQNDLLQSDLILFLRSYLHSQEDLWPPRCIIYIQEQSLDLFQRAISREWFKDLAALLNVKSKADLLAKVTDLEKERPLEKVFHPWDYGRLFLSDLFNLENLDVL